MPRKKAAAKPAVAPPSEGTCRDEATQQPRSIRAKLATSPAPEGWQTLALPASTASRPERLEISRVRCPDCACPDCPILEGTARPLSKGRVRHSHACRHCGREFLHVHKK